jgi:hypothetical protein
VTGKKKFLSDHLETVRVRLAPPERRKCARPGLKEGLMLSDILRFLIIFAGVASVGVFARKLSFGQALPECTQSSVKSPTVVWLVLLFSTVCGKYHSYDY